MDLDALVATGLLFDELIALASMATCVATTSGSIEEPLSGRTVAIGETHGDCVGLDRVGGLLFFLVNRAVHRI